MTPLILWSGGAVVAALLLLAAIRLPPQRTAALLVLALAAGLALARQFPLALPLAFAAFSIWRSAPATSRRRARAPRFSEVESAWLSMRLDHDSGRMDGVIRRGPLAGQILSQLSPADLQTIAQAIRDDGDAESLALLDAWLERHGPEGAPDDESASSKGEMSAEEAYRVLGLSPGASSEEIRAAHHRLIRKVHPDTGGSAALAALINAAKARLDPARDGHRP